MAGPARRILVFGVVQGVGFRPFVHRLAGRLGLRGWVKNVGRGVEIHVEGPSRAGLDAFERGLRRDKPPLAVIESVASRPAPFERRASFEIRASRRGRSFVFISPDISVCPDCLRDIRAPRDRRYRYAFTNCTNCGPRYTIVRGLPYDRPQTTMAGFRMCPDCAREYADPGDRRYHAQPIACPACGPSVVLRRAGSSKPFRGGIEEAARLLSRGRILAVKGLGGFHLMADPRSAAAVARLRALKDRRVKPFALMAADLRAAARWVHISAAEKRLLLSPYRPVVLLRKKRDIPGVAPNLNELGIMLPYTPLHVLLLERLPLVVATSSNPKDSPIIKDESEGLDGLCDYVLSHDRPIHMRADDSVVKVVRGGPVFVRRARGFVPAPQRVPDGLRRKGRVLALGGELKDTVSVYKDGYVVTSQFLGDMDDYRNRVYFEETVAHLRRLFDVRPDCVVSDRHPDFHTTRWAERSGLPHFRVQHHHAHVLAVMLEHGLPVSERVLGIVWDGYGYGADGTPWGGEFLLADYRECERFAHFETVPLPGGDLAARQPWRMALSYLRAGGARAIPRLPAFRSVEPKTLRAVWDLCRPGRHAPSASSCGRLFDAVAALAGVAPRENEFEAEAAMRLEAAAASARTSARYPFAFFEPGEGPARILFGKTIEAVLEDVRAGRSASTIAARFHNTLAAAALEAARRARARYGLRTVALGGGVFLNRVLLERTLEGLEKEGFRVLRPLAYSPNDESISLGQVAFALARMKDGRTPRVNRAS